MNELDRRLTEALRQLSDQYAEDMSTLQRQNERLSAQVESLSGQLNRLTGVLTNLTGQLGQLSKP